MDILLDYLGKCISIIDTFIAVLSIIKTKSGQSEKRITFVIIVIFILQISLFLIISFYFSTQFFFIISLLFLIVLSYLERERIGKILRDPSKIRRRWYVVTILIVGTIIQFSLLNWAFQDKEKIIDVMKYNTIPLSTTIPDRQGNFNSYFANNNLWLITHEELPQHVADLAVLEKDPTFFEHPGFDIWGGETVTQYVVRNNLLKDDSIIEKVRGYLLASMIEQMYSKRQILQTYVNTRSFSDVDMHQKYGNMHGIETAAYIYFHKKTSELTLAETAFLFSLPTSDTSSQKITYEDILKKRKGLLELLYKNRKITVDEKNKAQKDKLFFSKTEQPQSEFLTEVRNELIQSIGEKMATEKGLRVSTTQDTNLEISLRNLMKSELSQIGTEDTLAMDVLILNHTTGEIVSGFSQSGSDQPSSSGPFSRIIPAENSIKLFVYLQAFDNRMLSTGKTNTDVYCFTENEFLFYCPPNIAKQIAESNTNVTYPSITPLLVLIKNLGHNTTLQNLKRLGIRFPSEKDINLPQIIKSSNIQLKDAAQLHALFMNEGKKKNLHFVLHVTDKDDNEITLLTHPSARKEGPQEVSSQALEAILPIFRQKTVNENTMILFRSSNDATRLIIGARSPYLAIVAIRYSDFAAYEDNLVIDLVEKILDSTIENADRGKY